MYCGRESLLLNPPCAKFTHQMSTLSLLSLLLSARYSMANALLWAIWPRTDVEFCASPLVARGAEAAEVENAGPWWRGEQRQLREMKTGVRTPLVPVLSWSLRTFPINYRYQLRFVKILYNRYPVLSIPSRMISVRTKLTIRNPRFQAQGQTALHDSPSVFSAPTGSTHALDQKTA